MAALPGIINLVVISVLVMKRSSESDEYSTVNLTVGRPGSLRCSHPLNLKGQVIAYWQHESQTICYYKTNTSQRCDGFQHQVAEREIILTIPKVKISDSGKYSCFVFIEGKHFECTINVRMISEARMVNPGSNGIHLKAGLIFLLPLAMVIWNF